MKENQGKLDGFWQQDTVDVFNTFLLQKSKAFNLLLVYQKRRLRYRYIDKYRLLKKPTVIKKVEESR